MGQYNVQRYVRRLLELGASLIEKIPREVLNYITRRYVGVHRGSSLLTLCLR
jgi:hypothetical protein